MAVRLSFMRLRSAQKLLDVLPVISQQQRFLSPPDSATPKEAAEQVAVQQERNKAAGPMLELVRDFLDPADFFRSLTNVGVDFFCGVPDSLLKDFCAYMTDNVERSKHVITANEGTAVSLAAGYHLATGKFACVYLQNSGLGNCVNPLTSLAAGEVYSIPMILLVGWRGEPGKRDEPQHMVKGQLTPALLATLGIPFQILPDFQEGAERALYTAKKHIQHSLTPYAFLVKRQTFLPYTLQEQNTETYPLLREEALHTLMREINDRDVVVSTTGMLSRELFEYRHNLEQGHERDFLTVGSMGHASSIAMGIAMSKPKRRVWCLDGDGAALMHLGALASIGQRGPPNLKHVIINNGAHDSVGGQPTDAGNAATFSFTKAALALGYKEAFTASTPEEIQAATATLKSKEGPLLLEIKAKIGARSNLGRPNRSPIQNKADFMHFLQIS